MCCTFALKGTRAHWHEVAHAACGRGFPLLIDTSSRMPLSRLSSRFPSNAAITIVTSPSRAVSATFVPTASASGTSSKTRRFAIQNSSLFEHQALTDQRTNVASSSASSVSSWRKAPPSLGAQRRGLAPSRNRHDAADRVVGMLIVASATSAPVERPIVVPAPRDPRQAHSRTHACHPL